MTAQPRTRHIALTPARVGALERLARFHPAAAYEQRDDAPVTPRLTPDEVDELARLDHSRRHGFPAPHEL